MFGFPITQAPNGTPGNSNVMFRNGASNQYPNSITKSGGSDDPKRNGAPPGSVGFNQGNVFNAHNNPSNQNFYNLISYVPSHPPININEFSFSQNATNTSLLNSSGAYMQGNNAAGVKSNPMMQGHQGNGIIAPGATQHGMKNVGRMDNTMQKQEMIEQFGGFFNDPRKSDSHLRQHSPRVVLSKGRPPAPPIMLGKKPPTMSQPPQQQQQPTTATTVNSRTKLHHTESSGEIVEPSHQNKENSSQLTHSGDLKKEVVSPSHTCPLPTGRESAAGESPASRIMIPNGYYEAGGHTDEIPSKPALKQGEKCVSEGFSVEKESVMGVNIASVMDRLKPIPNEFDGIKFVPRTGRSGPGITGLDDFVANVGSHSNRLNSSNDQLTRSQIPIIMPYTERKEDPLFEEQSEQNEEDMEQEELYDDQENPEDEQEGEEDDDQEVHMDEERSEDMDQEEYIEEGEEIEEENGEEEHEGELDGENEAEEEEVMEQDEEEEQEEDGHIDSRRGPGGLYKGRANNNSNPASDPYEGVDVDDEEGDSMKEQDDEVDDDEHQQQEEYEEGEELEYAEDQEEEPQEEYDDDDDRQVEMEEYEEEEEEEKSSPVRMQRSKTQQQYQRYLQQQQQQQLSTRSKKKNSVAPASKIKDSLAQFRDDISFKTAKKRSFYNDKVTMISPIPVSPEHDRESLGMGYKNSTGRSRYVVPDVPQRKKAGKQSLPPPQEKTRSNTRTLNRSELRDIEESERSESEEISPYDEEDEESIERRPKRTKSVKTHQRSNDRYGGRRHKRDSSRRDKSRDNRSPSSSIKKSKKQQTPPNMQQASAMFPPGVNFANIPPQFYNGMMYNPYMNYTAPAPGFWPPTAPPAQYYQIPGSNGVILIPSATPQMAMNPMVPFMVPAPAPTQPMQLPTQQPQQGIPVYPPQPQIPQSAVQVSQQREMRHPGEFLQSTPLQSTPVPQTPDSNSSLHMMNTASNLSGKLMSQQGISTKKSTPTVNNIEHSLSGNSVKTTTNTQQKVMNMVTTGTQVCMNESVMTGGNRGSESKTLERSFVGTNQESNNHLLNSAKLTAVMDNITILNDNNNNNTSMASMAKWVENPTNVTANQQKSRVLDSPVERTPVKTISLPEKKPSAKRAAESLTMKQASSPQHQLEIQMPKQPAVKLEFNFNRSDEVTPVTSSSKKESLADLFKKRRQDLFNKFEDEEKKTSKRQTNGAGGGANPPRTKEELIQIRKDFVRVGRKKPSHMDGSNNVESPLIVVGGPQSLNIKEDEMSELFSPIVFANKMPRTPKDPHQQQHTTYKSPQPGGGSHHLTQQMQQRPSTSSMTRPSGGNQIFQNGPTSQTNRMGSRKGHRGVDGPLNPRRNQLTPSVSKSKDPDEELAIRLAMGIKKKVSRKEMIEMTNKHYDQLPEVVKKREEQRKNEEKMEDFKARKEKMKKLDERLRKNIIEKKV